MAKYTKKKYRRSKKHNKKRKSTRKYKGGAGSAIKLSTRPYASSSGQIERALDKTMPYPYGSVDTGQLNLEIEDQKKNSKWWRKFMPDSGTGLRGSTMVIERNRLADIVDDNGGNILDEELITSCRDIDDGQTYCTAQCNDKFWGKVRRKSFNNAREDDSLNVKLYGNLKGNLYNKKGKYIKCKKSDIK